MTVKQWSPVWREETGRFLNSFHWYHGFGKQLLEPADAFEKVSGIQCIGVAFTELSCRLDVEPHVRDNVIPGIGSVHVELCICLLDLSVSLLTVLSRNRGLGRVCNTVTTRRAVDHMTDASAVLKRTNFRFRAMTAGRCPRSRRRLKLISISRTHTAKAQLEHPARAPRKHSELARFPHDTPSRHDRTCTTPFRTPSTT